MAIADPPYYHVLAQDWDQQWPDARAYLTWSLAWLDAAIRVLRADGLLYGFGQLGRREHHFPHLMAAATRRWQFRDLITWDRVVGNNERRNSFTPATKLILVLRKSAKPKFNKSAVREPYGAATIKDHLRDNDIRIGRPDDGIWPQVNSPPTCGASPASRATPVKSAATPHRSPSS